LEIRPYRDDDEPGVIGLWSRVFPNPSPWNDPSEDIARKLGVHRELFIVAELEGRIVGTAMGGYDGHRGWVYYVAVGPDHRRKGIGTALMGRVERELSLAGCHKVNLQVRGSDAEAVAFYESLGYASEDRISMGKRLAEESV
jgi:ribosomal protein S18 acetylase RimI-like enzyme